MSNEMDPIARHVGTSLNLITGIMIAIAGVTILGAPGLSPFVGGAIMTVGGGLAFWAVLAGTGLIKPLDLSFY